MSCCGWMRVNRPVLFVACPQDALEAFEWVIRNLHKPGEVSCGVVEQRSGKRGMAGGEVLGATELLQCVSLHRQRMRSISCVSCFPVFAFLQLIVPAFLPSYCRRRTSTSCTLSPSSSRPQPQEASTTTQVSMKTRRRSCGCKQRCLGFCIWGVWGQMLGGKRQCWETALPMPCA